MSIRIKSKKAGFRRCGIAHPAEFVEYPDNKFSAEQLKTLKAEKMLIVEVGKPGAAQAAAAAAKAKEEAAVKAEAEKLAQEEAERGAQTKRLADEEAEKNKGEDLSLLTAAQLQDAISEFNPAQKFKGLKKEELIEILKAHREAAKE